MSTVYYLKEGLIFFTFWVYPLTELYGYFVYIGIFCLEIVIFDSWTLSICISLYSAFLSLKIILYLQIKAAGDKSTLRLFPSTLKNSIIRLFTNMNPFIIEGQVLENAEKIQTCDICETYKPPRTHHCNRCNRCFLKYDHHDYLLGLCIGFHNYKLFYQFIVVNFLSALLFITAIVFNPRLYGSVKTTTYVYIGIGIGLFAVKLIFYGYELVFHTYLITNNETTVEHYALNEYLMGNYTHVYIFQEGQIKSFATTKDRAILNPYNRGPAENWADVFGKDPVKWFLPVFSSQGNGVAFKTNAETSTI